MGKLSKFSVADIIRKKELEITKQFADGRTEHTEHTESSRNRMTDPLAIDPPTTLLDIGAMDVEIPNTENAQYSPHNKYLHVKSATGNTNPGFQTKLTFHDVPRRKTAKYYLRCYLTRDNTSTRHIPVDTVCEKHRPHKDLLPNHVLRYQPETNSQVIAVNYINGVQPSLLIQLQPPKHKDIQTTVRMYMMCLDTCPNTKNPDPKTRSKYVMRDLRLVQTLEIHNHQDKQITHQRSRLIWPKAQIAGRELKMNPRRGPQGGLATKTKKGKQPNTGQRKQKRHPTRYLKQLGIGTWNVDKAWVNKFFDIKAQEGEATLTLTRNLATGQTNAIMKSSHPLKWPPEL